jgi:glycerol-3-phosphate O-acyltransferase/dihydroxyacetone phosphate acyltransferase
VLYHLLRGTAASALRWYYSDIVVQGAERVPPHGPLVIVANHPNALIDPVLVGTAVTRRVRLTAKATLFEQPALAPVLHAVGVVPLRRSKDESRDGAPAVVTPERNAYAFQLVTSALCAGEAVLVFPEGVSHDDPALAPLRSGAARMALQAQTEGVTGVQLLPIGLVFEQKERPESRVLVRVGEPLDLDAWLASHDGPAAVHALTRALEERLRAVTLNFASAERAVRAVRLARTLSALTGTPAPVDEPRSLDAEAALAIRIDAAMSALPDAPPDVIDSADVLSARLGAIEHELDRRGISLVDVRISMRLPDAAAFVAREGPLVLLALLAVVFGWATHWVPLRAARRLALRSLRSDGSRDQPAMRTILAGLSAVIVWYVVQAIVITHYAGALAAFLWLVLMFAAAHVLRLRRGRLRRALRRARTFLAFRADPALQPRIVAEIDALLGDVLTLERALVASHSSRSRSRDA